MIIKNNLIGPKTKQVISEDTKNKIRLKLINRKLSDNHKKNISSALKSKFKNGKDNSHCFKKIEQYKNNELIKIFNSVKEASISMGLHPSNISHCLKQHQKTAGGFTWKYSKN